jgi:uncharacterized protein (DUF488 family)
MHLFTIGYGGRKPPDLVAALQAAGVQTLVDVRLRPDRASMGALTLAKTPDKGIERLLADGGIGYVSLVELGNLFRHYDDWPQRYAMLLNSAGDLLTERLRDVPAPFCLMCSERKVEECHRRQIAEHLLTRGYTVTHLT